MNTYIRNTIGNLNSKAEKLSDILRHIVDICKIDQKKYCIIGSYAIRLQREINDLDIIMESGEFDLLRKLSVGIFEVYNHQDRYFLDMTDIYNEIVSPPVKDFSIEIFRKKIDEGFPTSKYSIQTLRNTGGLDTDENGHPFFNKKTLLAWKKEMNRAKNQPNIELLTRMIRKPRKTHRKTKKAKRK